MYQYIVDISSWDTAVVKGMGSMFAQSPFNQVSRDFLLFSDYLFCRISMGCWQRQRLEFKVFQQSTVQPALKCMVPYLIPHTSTSHLIPHTSYLIPHASSSIFIITSESSGTLVELRRYGKHSLWIPGVNSTRSCISTASYSCICFRMHA